MCMYQLYTFLPEINIFVFQYVFGEPKMTDIFSVYHQASGFPSQPFECFLKQLGRYGVSLLYSSPDVDLVAFFVYVDCHRAVCVDVFHEFDVYVF